MQAHKLPGGRASHGLGAATGDCRDNLVPLCPRDHLDMPLSSPPGLSAPSASCPRYTYHTRLIPLFTHCRLRQWPKGLPKAWVSLGPGSKEQLQSQFMPGCTKWLGSHQQCPPGTELGCGSGLTAGRPMFQGMLSCPLHPDDSSSPLSGSSKRHPVFQQCSLLTKMPACVFRWSPELCWHR